MKYGIIADIHANLEALQAVLTYQMNEGVQGYLCLGDLVGYGPNPNEVVQMVKALPGLVCVAGNHDRVATGEVDPTDFNDSAHQAILWTRENLADESRQFLVSLTNEAVFEDIYMVHGTPRDPLSEYLQNVQQFWDNEPYFTSPISFIAHSHIPLVIQKGAEEGTYLRHLKDGNFVSTNPLGKTIYNPGSVGQPRDEDPRASCAVYDADVRTIYLKRVEYDIPKVQDKMKKAGLPDALVRRLSLGF